ncbi:DUF1294 domain-containing protein [Thermobrachium celere]|uniref:DUF1294 domain-containing protein n=1 Tax=Thermobrachium celere TaxID=53422 RepID=UPI000592D079|nr:DUF1294 domain-containing protein [Thermobrachium celere]
MSHFTCLALCINLIGIVFMMVDKFKSKFRMWRVRESSLLFIALIGGSIGICFGMYIFNHKTRKPKFKYGIPAIIFLQLLIWFLIFK